MAFSIKSGMTNLTRVSTTLGYYLGAWGEEVQIVNSSALFVGSGIRLEDDDKSNYIELSAPSSVSSNYTIEFPAAAPGSNTFLKYNGSAYVWAAGGGGGSGDINNGGNAFGSAISIGTTDNFNLNLIANNTTVAIFNTSALKVVDGSSLAPSYAFINDSDTGMYSGGGGAIDFTANGTFGLRVYSGGLRSVNGTVSAPTYSFINDTDTGIYLSATNTIGIATNGALSGSVNGNGLWTLGVASGTQDHAINGTFNAISSKTSQASWRFRNLQTGNTAANAVLLVGTADGTGGSPFINYNIGSGTQNWSAGVNNGSSDRYEIAASSGLGTNSYFTISTSGLVNVGAPGGTQQHVVNGSLNLAATGEVRFQDTTGGEYAGFKAPGTISASHTYTLPSALPASSKILLSNSSGTLSWVDPTKTVGITIDGGGSAITTGLKGFIEVPFSGTITGWTILGDTTGSIVVDVWKDTYANFPPDATDSIAGSEKPTISSAVKGQDLSLSTWTTTTITAGDIIAFNVDSCTSITRATIVIRVTPT